MPSNICAIVNTSSDTQNGRVVSRAIARDPTMLLTAYQPLALTQFKRAGKYAPRRPKLWRVNESWGIPISGPMLAVSASKLHPMRFPTRMAITPSTKPRPNTIASAPTSQTGSPILAESQSVNNARGRPCRSLAETCSIPCGSTVSTCPRYSPPHELSPGNRSIASLRNVRSRGRASPRLSRSVARRTMRRASQETIGH